MCQLPVINPMRSTAQAGGHQFEDPSEPIYTDPSLFERSRQVDLRFFFPFLFQFVATN